MVTAYLPDLLYGLASLGVYLLNLSMLGAWTGLAVLGTRAGSRAAGWGMAIAWLPELDRLSGLGGWASYWELHSGPSHSLLAAVALALLAGPLIDRLDRRRHASPRAWMRLAFAVLLAHFGFDTLGTEGADWLYPFSNARISLNACAPDDPAIGIPLLALLLLQRRRPAHRTALAVTAGLWVVLMLALSITHKQAMTLVFRQTLHRIGRSVQRLETFPGPFGPLVWHAAAQEPGGYDIGYLSVLHRGRDIRFQHVPAQHTLAEQTAQDRVLAKGFAEWTRRFYALECRGDTLLLHDLRAGLLPAEAREPAQPLRSYHFSAEGLRLLPAPPAAERAERMWQVLHGRSW